MRKLNFIQLYMDGRDTEISKSINFESRVVCNYIEQRIQAKPIDYPYHTLTFVFNEENQPVITKPIKTSGYLEIYFQYPLENYPQLSSAEKIETFIQIIEQGLRYANEFKALPLDFFEHIITDYRKQNYQNTWQITTKHWQTQNLTATLEANLTLDNFYLTQKITQDDKILFDKIIVQSSPRERIFQRFLGKLSLNSENIIVYKNTKLIISQFDLSNKTMTITNNVFNKLQT